MRAREERRKRSRKEFGIPTHVYVVVVRWWGIFFLRLRPNPPTAEEKETKYKILFCYDFFFFFLQSLFVMKFTKFYNYFLHFDNFTVIF